MACPGSEPIYVNQTYSIWISQVVGLYSRILLTSCRNSHRFLQYKEFSFVNSLHEEWSISLDESSGRDAASSLI